MASDREGVLAVVPARGGSKGVPDKNLRRVGGMPLISWTVRAAQSVTEIDRLIVSSDDRRIIAVAEEAGCEAPFLRPDELSGDTAPTIDVILHALERMPGFAKVVVLQPTSPLRSAEDIRACLSLSRSSGAPSVCSVTAVSKHPHWMFGLSPSGRLQRFIESDELELRRQDLPSLFALNGAVYVADTEWLVESGAFVTPDTVGYVMPAERSFDIDSEFDLRVCDLLLTQDSQTRGRSGC